MSQELVYKNATELAQLIRDKEISSVQLTQSFIDRIEDKDSDINAVIVRRFEKALEEASIADQQLAAGQNNGPLHGVPMTIKESYVLTDTPATWGIPAYKDNVSKTDGLAVQRFKQAGAHFLGKTNVPIDLADFQSYNDIYGTTNNPWNYAHVPGGSSGGSGASLAAGFAALEAGSDIGGSIRTPAHFSGVFGHKPTYGIIPMQGHELMSGVPDADLSVCGPLARSAEDLAVALDIMAGPAGRDSVGWQLNLPKPNINSVKGLRIALWPTDELAPVSQETEARVNAIGQLLAEHGAIVDDQARPNFDKHKAHITYTNLLTAVMSSAQPPELVEQTQKHVAQLDPNDQSHSAIQARATIMMHRDWIRHNFRREKLRASWDEFFSEYDALICPQFTVPAIPHDHRPFAERTINVDGEERPYFEPLFWSGLIIASYLPSTVFPTGPGQAGLPIGLQVVGGAYQDHKTIRISQLIAELNGGFQAPPNL